MNVDVALADRLSTLAGGRIYPMLAPQGATLPHIVYQLVSGGHRHTLAGGAGHAAPRFQLTCWADTYTAAAELGELVRNRVQGYSGTITVSGDDYVIGGITVIDTGDILNAAVGVEANREFGRRVDIEVVWAEAKPA